MLFVPITAALGVNAAAVHMATAATPTAAAAAPASSTAPAPGGSDARPFQTQVKAGRGTGRFLLRRNILHRFQYLLSKYLFKPGRARGFWLHTGVGRAPRFHTGRGSIKWPKARREAGCWPNTKGDTY